MYWFFPYCSQLSQQIFKTSRVAENHDQISINLTNVFDFLGEFSNYVAFDEIEWLCAVTKYKTEKFVTKPQSTLMSCY